MPNPQPPQSLDDLLARAEEFALFTMRTLLHQLMTAQLRVHDLDLDRLLARTG